MELLSLKIDKGEKMLIGLDLFLLISIVSAIIIYGTLKEYFDIQTAVYIGLGIGLIAIIYIVRSYKKWKKEKMK